MGKKLRALRISFFSALLSIFLSGPAYTACPPADLNRDCRVDLLDVRILAESWLAPPESSVDLNGDDSVDMGDFALLADQLYEIGIPLVINELMASNSTFLRDPQGQYDDWIEIHNFGVETIDAGGMYLTDDMSVPTKWWIPAKNRIPAGGYLLIWADNNTADAGLHANFKLSAGGEQISLFDSDGVTLIDSVAFGEQVSDISFGRYPDAGDDLRFFGFPSPAARNDGGYLDEIAEIGFSKKRGFYNTPIYITLATETEDAVIYYSLDGSEPYEATHRGIAYGTVYTEPILISRTSCLRAAAVRPGWMPTKIVAHTYLFLDDVVRQNYQDTLNAGFPTSWGSFSSPDYGMDRDIIGTFNARGQPNGDDRYNGIYATTIRSDLMSIPSLSIAMNVDDMFGRDGIYSNPTQHGIAYERPVSVELIYPDETEGFQVNCGIRIQGGAFRNFSLATKKSFRLLFKGMYGPTKLQFPLFGKDAADDFDTIVLRAGANDGYSWSSARYTEQYTRDEFGRSLQRATGHAGAHGTFVHLYINGMYWGLYNPCERPDNSFSASYYGGERDNWDAIHDNSASSGNLTAWNQMIAKCQQAANSNEAYLELQGRNPDGMRNPATPHLLDVTNYVDYLIVNLWGGNWDWPWKNWWAGRDKSDSSTGFKFYNWDYENTMGNNLGRSPLNKNALNNNFSQAGVPHQSLRQNAEYRLFFADRVHRIFFNEGVLTPVSLIRRYAALANTIERAIVAESARWGDQHHSTPLTLENWYDRDGNFSDGRAGRDWILKYYLLQRSDIVLQQFRDAGLYPNVDAPVYYIDGAYQHGGSISTRDALSMNAPTGTIWYTLDGADPRQKAESSSDSSSVTLVAENIDKRVLVPVRGIGDNWRSSARYNDSSWMLCTGSPGGVGYERSSGYQNFISLDLQDQMYARNATCYIRIPFTFNGGLDEFNIMTLNIRYDDGFVAYLNGIEIARRNFNGLLTWNSNASTSRSDSQAVNFESIDISSFLNHLQRGNNLLAIHGLNVSPTSSDLLMSAELIAGQAASVDAGGISPNANRHTNPITLDHSANVKARVLSNDTWSALNEAIFAVGPVAENLRITEIMYHPQILIDIGEPNEEFIELTNIGAETLNLNLVRFTNGFDFTFPSLDLVPGEYIVVVQDIEA
ncbi:CotH kinase family protein, partial [Planctomycetota bacterium]